MVENEESERRPVAATSRVEQAAVPASLATRPIALSPEDEAELAQAFRALENSSFAAYLTGMVGRQIGYAGELIPGRVAAAALR